MAKKRYATTDSDTILHNMIASSPLGAFFGVSQEVFDQVWANLCAPDRNSVTYISMEIGADLDVFNPVKSRLQEMEVVDDTDPQLDRFIKSFLFGPEKIPNYGGGLGILAGDTLKSFSDNKIPVLAISLMFRKGYFSQLVDSKIGQIAWSTDWEPEKTPLIYLLKDPKNPSKPLRIEVPFYDRQDVKTLAYAQLWMKMEVSQNLDYFVPEILLDFSVPETPQWIRETSFHLYDSSTEETKAIQRRLLGGGARPVMRALGITSHTIHLNEQHGAVVIMHLIEEWLHERLGPDFKSLARESDIKNAAEEVAQHIVYTIHTPVKAGHDRFEKHLYQGLGHSFSQKMLEVLASNPDDPYHFNFTKLAMQVNRATNAVSRLHKQVTCQQFPEFAQKITAITNGVHHLTWISAAKAEVYDSFPELDNWRQDPGVFANAALLQKNNKFRTYLEQAWASDSERLITYVNRMLILHRSQMYETWIDPPNFLSHLDEKERNLRPSDLTIGFARRFSTYKRADLIFNDMDRLAEIIVASGKRVNFIFAGKAHPSDEPGKSIIKLILDLQHDLYLKSKGLAKLVFVPGYDMQIAKLMVAGVHVWLNSPKRPLEASGTSGMKAAMNAVPNISILDGWWAEGYHEGASGWKIGVETGDMGNLSENPHDLLYDEDAETFYRIFPEIMNSFYDHDLRSTYLDKCIMNLVLNCPIFNTHRMISEYIKKYGLKLPGPIAKKISRLGALYDSDPKA